MTMDADVAKDESELENIEFIDRPSTMGGTYRNFLLQEWKAAFNSLKRKGFGNDRFNCRLLQAITQVEQFYVYKRLRKCIFSFDCHNYIVMSLTHQSHLPQRLAIIGPRQHSHGHIL